MIRRIPKQHHIEESRTKTIAKFFERRVGASEQVGLGAVHGKAGISQRIQDVTVSRQYPGGQQGMALHRVRFPQGVVVRIRIASMVGVEGIEDDTHRQAPI